MMLGSFKNFSEQITSGISDVTPSKQSEAAAGDLSGYLLMRPHCAQPGPRVIEFVAEK
jgi:hypothetical protein